MQNTDWIDRNEYPFTSRYFDLPMGRMHYVDEGQGHPIVMAHGAPEWSFGYRHLIKGLSKQFRCIAFDHIGFGLSDKPHGWSYLPKDHAQNVKRFIEHLGLKQFTLVAHDFGGPISLSYALEHPERVSDLVLMNTWMWSLKGDRHFESAKLFSGAIGRFLYKRLALSPKVILKMAYGDKSKLTPDIHQHYLKPFSSSQDRHSTWVFARELLGSSDWYDSLWQKRDRLREIPMLFLWGLKDFAFREKELNRWREHFPDAAVVPFPDAGHFVQEEQGEEVSGLIAEFVQKRIESEASLRLS